MGTALHIYNIKIVSAYPHLPRLEAQGGCQVEDTDFWKWQVKATSPTLLIN